MAALKPLLGYRLSVLRDGQEAPEWRGVPVAWAEYCGYDRCRAFAMPLHRRFHLLVVAVVREDEVRTDQQQHDVRRVEFVLDLGMHVRDRLDSSVVPRFDQALPPQQVEVLDEFV